MPFISTKTYGSNLGLSVAFRQWRAKSHCNKLHGYSLEVKIAFGCDELDDTNWCVDFGALKPLKARLESMFDHKTLVAEDDPEMSLFVEARDRGVLDLVVVPAVGCEKFAELVFNIAQTWLRESGLKSRCFVISAEVREHGANSAIYTRNPQGAPI